MRPTVGSFFHILRAVDQAAIRKHIATTYPGVVVDIASPGDGSPEMAWGDTFFIYDPGRNLEGSRRFPFATIVTKDYENWDSASDLNRPDVFRLNIGLSRQPTNRYSARTPTASMTSPRSTGSCRTPSTEGTIGSACSTRAPRPLNRCSHCWRRLTTSS
jgi:hypothetical protein